MSDRVLAIDHGLKRIGLAVSDPSRTIARELRILVRKSKAEDFAQIQQILETEQIGLILVGIPHSEASAGVHTQADTVRTWITRLREVTDLPVIEWDEQLSSDDAREIARHQRRKPDAPIDDLAARVILQSYLDALRDGLA